MCASATNGRLTVDLSARNHFNNIVAHFVRYYPWEITHSSLGHNSKSVCMLPKNWFFGLKNSGLPSFQFWWKPSCSLYSRCFVIGQICSIRCLLPWQHYGKTITGKMVITFQINGSSICHWIDPVAAPCNRVKDEFAVHGATC